MPKKLLLTLQAILVTCIAISQTFSLKGSIIDTTTENHGQNAVVSVLRAKDSVLTKFSRTDAHGNFVVKNIPPGKYVLLVTHPALADYADIIDVNQDKDLGKIDMLSKAVVLQNVIVRGSPIRMKGDTLAYIADSFKVKDGATVEDLLKKLPGIQVNSKGEITAQGERVEKVLVDGEEFFGDDPTLATQNMIAKAVKEVQVFDKKSDQAAFTGVDDGQKTKTINLKLKDEFKKGNFGKVKLAGGLPDSWQNSAMINAFNDKRKFSVYGKMANTGETGLGWGEENQYGGGLSNNMEMTDDGGIMMWNNGDDFSGGGGNYGGEGLPKSWMGGTSYSNKWNNDKIAANGAYRYQRLSTEGTTTTNTQTILPDTQYYNNQVAQTQSSRWRHKANAKSDITIDSLQSLTITADGSYGQSMNNTLLNSEALTSSKQPVNKNRQSTSTNGTNGSFNVNALYKKKFAKKGRTLSFNLAEKYNMSDADGFLKSGLEIYRDGAYVRTDTTDQKKTTDNNNINLDTKLSYTEPLGKNGIVEIGYGYSFSNSEQKRLSYDNENGKYETLNELYSNDYKFVTNTHKTNLAYRYNYKKVVFGIGSDVTFSDWKQTDLFTDSVRKYNYTNFFPRVNFSYKLGQYSRIRFNYTGRTQAPSINQLQPVANNADPTNIAVGNPDLKQSFNSNFQLSYNFYQVLKDQGMYVNLYFNPTQNAFSSFDVVDQAGRRIYKTVNVDGNYSGGGWFGYNFKWKKPDIRIGLNFNPQLSRIKNYVNGRENETKNTSLNFGMWVGKYKEKKYEFNLGLDAGYNYATSSISPDVVTKYWTATPTLNTNIFLPKDFEFNTDMNYYWRQQTDVFSNNNSFIWNASLNKKIIKKKDLRLGVTVHDILNQNIGFRRDVSSNYITEKTYNVIGRYWLATLTWNFNKGPKKEEQW